MKSIILKFRNCRFIIPVLIAVSLFNSARSLSADSDTKLTNTEMKKIEIPVLGYIEEDEYLNIAHKIKSDYLSGIANNKRERIFAQALVAYIGPSLVENGKFVPPPNFYIPPDQLEIMAGKIFPDEECIIERLVFKAEKQFIVLAVDASDTPSQENIERCLLGATLAALGEDLDGQPIMPNSEMRNLIEEIVNGG